MQLVEVEQDHQEDVDQIQLMAQYQLFQQSHQQVVAVEQKISLQKVMEIQELLVVEV